MKNRKPKYRILQINDVFIVQKRTLWWWFDITIECDGMTFPYSFSTREKAEEYIEALGLCFYPVITKVCEYDHKGIAIQSEDAAP